LFRQKTIEISQKKSFFFLVSCYFPLSSTGSVENRKEINRETVGEGNGRAGKVVSFLKLKIEANKEIRRKADACFFLPNTT
jgi:hypothetical protein